MMSGERTERLCHCTLPHCTLPKCTLPHCTLHTAHHPLAQVLLDDDVVPDSALLDAYLGAIARYPKAKILVGLTRLPEPQTLMQHALVRGRGGVSRLDRQAVR